MDPREEMLLEDARARRGANLGDRELLAAIFCAVGFVVAVAVVIETLGEGQTPPLLRSLVLLACFALATRVEFEAGAGSTDATQIVFVAVLLTLPPVWAPAIAVGGLILGRAPDYLRGRRHPARALLALRDSWYALGPAIVLGAANIHGAHWGDWPWWVAALGAQFAVDLIVAVVLERVSYGSFPPFGIIGQVYVADLLLTPVGLLAALASDDRPYAFVLVMPLLVLMLFFARERRAGLDQAIELSRTYRRTALLLGDVIGEDDEYTGAHSQGVVSLAVAVADELGLGDSDRRLVEFGALLHDVGKIAMPKQIINKPGPLTDEEWSIVRRHTIEGQRMLDRIGGALKDVGVVVRASHEMWDGSGYPDGLAGEDIPLAARVICAADAFSAMTTDRPYRAARDRAVAVAELRRCSGEQFDPRVAEATIVIVERYSLPRQGPSELSLEALTDLRPAQA
jgi:putative nucleotidyltransferase with HDIG domain